MTFWDDLKNLDKTPGIPGIKGSTVIDPLGIPYGLGYQVFGNQVWEGVIGGAQNTFDTGGNFLNNGIDNIDKGIDKGLDAGKKLKEYLPYIVLGGGALFLIYTLK